MFNLSLYYTVYLWPKPGNKKIDVMSRLSRYYLCILCTLRCGSSKSNIETPPNILKFIKNRGRVLIRCKGFDVIMYIAGV